MTVVKGKPTSDPASEKVADPFDSDTNSGDISKTSKVVVTNLESPAIDATPDQESNMKHRISIYHFLLFGSISGIAFGVFVGYFVGHWQLNKEKRKGVPQVQYSDTLGRMMTCVKIIEGLLVESLGLKASWVGLVFV